MVLFALMHIKGTDVWAIIDVFSVAILALGFTYVAYKTRSLVAGIVFHYVHDAFLFLVQVPEGVQTGVTDSLLFYGLLWLALGAGCLVTKVAADRLGVQAAAELYRVERVDGGCETLQARGTSQIGA